MFLPSTILCLAYILGLLSTAVSWGRYGVLILGIVIAFSIYFGKKFSYKNQLLINFWQIKPQVWLAAGLVGFFATLYFQIRTPQPTVNDISQFITTNNIPALPQIATVHGKITSTPRITRNQRGQFWLEATQLNSESSSINKKVTGKLYVTVPLRQVADLYQSQEIAVTGTLYKPKPAKNPGGFDFRAYLAQEGGFAGLKGRQVSLLNRQHHNQWGWWIIRRRIIRSQGRWLNVPEGALVSAMVLGNKVVNVPFAVSDAFVKVGLAHALAASGFQVSLILGVVLTLTRRFSSQIQFGFGVTALLIFLGLTGPQPSVLRAVFMGVGALIALVAQRKVKPLELLLLAATVLLLLNPLWIWNLGFEFSFLATIGLVVTVPALMKRLDWLPPVLATLIAVPIAAYIWTLPLQLHAFGLVSPYSILVNIITTLPLSIISIGAFISAIAALALPIAGSALAWLLYYPTHILIAVVEFFGQLPGATVAVGTISALQLVTLYGIIILVCWQSWWQKRWWVACLITIGLVIIPVWQAQATLFRITVLAAGTEPVTVMQNRGKVLLVNSGDESTARFTVLPFLQQQGINSINWAITTNTQVNQDSGWLTILQSLPIKNFYDYSSTQKNLIIQNAVRSRSGNYQALSTNQMVVTGSTAIQLLDPQTQTLQLKIKDQTWLILGQVKPDEQKLPSAQVLLWSGKALNTDLLAAVRPEVAIATSTSVDEVTLSKLRQYKTQLFLTGKDGAIQWTPTDKFEATVIEQTNNAFAL